MTYKWYGDKAKKQIKDVVIKGLTGMAADGVKQAKANASQPKANASQPKGSDKHPQRQTGTLVRAITMDVDEGKLEAKIGIMKGSENADEALEYAEPLEMGTSRHPPYPYLFPAAEQVTKRAKEYF